jgi:hypothetical protein
MESVYRHLNASGSLLANQTTVAGTGSVSATGKAIRNFALTVAWDWHIALLMKNGLGPFLLVVIFITNADILLV